VATDSELVERYLEYVRTEKRLAQRTVELYALDLGKLQDFAAGSTPMALGRGLGALGVRTSCTGLLATKPWRPSHT